MVMSCDTFRRSSDVEAFSSSAGALGRIGAGDAKVGAAAEMNPADILDGERDDVLDVALHDPFEPVAHADDVDAFETRADRRGADDAVDTRCRAASDEDCEVVVFHLALRDCYVRSPGRDGGL